MVSAASWPGLNRAGLALVGLVFLVLLPQSSRPQLCRSIACFKLLPDPRITSLIPPQKTFGLAPASSSLLPCWAGSRLQCSGEPLSIPGPVRPWGQRATGLGSGAGIRHLPQLRDPHHVSPPCAGLSGLEGFSAVE